MNYRALGKTGLRVSALGFGCMRLPMKGERVDDELAIPLLRRAVARGVTYFDSAVGYCRRDSQRALGDALEGLRDRVVLSTKNPMKDPNDLDAWWRNLDESLELLKTEYIDVYHVHGLSWAAYERGFKDGGPVLAAMLRARDHGLIRHLAFSSHDTAENIVRLAEEGVFDSVTLQYNLLNRANAPAIARLGELGIGVVVMGPVAGGRLANQTVEGEAGGATSAELALKFVLANPDVSVALSGMSDLEMLEENLDVASGDTALSADESAEIARASEAQAALREHYCTSCGYCLPCPAGVNIPGAFTVAQLDQAYGMTELAKKHYAMTEGRARFCLQCGACVEKCPQDLVIPERMWTVVRRLDPEFGRPAIEASVTELAPCDEGLRIDFLVTAANLSDEAAEGTVTFEIAGRELLREEVALGPRSHRRFKAWAVVRPGETRKRLDYLAAFEGAEGHPSHHGRVRALFAHLHDDDSPVTPDQDAVDDATQLVAGNLDMASSHGARFRLCVEGDRLVLTADVDEDLQGPDRPAAGVEADSLVWCLDARPDDKRLTNPPGPGCFVWRLTPGLDEGRARAWRGEGERIEETDNVEVTAEAREGGYRLVARAPLELLGVQDAPRVIGFNLAQVSTDPDGRIDGVLAWAGQGPQWRQPAGWGMLRVQPGDRPMTEDAGDAAGGETAPAASVSEGVDPATLPRPSGKQIAWQDMELGLAYHFDIPVFAPGGWTHGAKKERYDPGIYNPARLDMDQWLEAAKAAGARYAIFTATHEGGFLQWQSDLYEYGMKQSPWRNGRGDPVREFKEACERAGVAPGVYMSLRHNSYWGARQWDVSDLRCDADDKRRWYARLCESILEELCSRYGPWFEIWFDGGVIPPGEGGPEIVPIIEKHQPDAIVYPGAQLMDHRWAGNERGAADDPCWATIPDASSAWGIHIGDSEELERLRGSGDPDGRHWQPAMCDAPIREHDWFWVPDSDHKIQPLDRLLDMYAGSVGRNANLMLGATPDRDGLIPEADMQRYREFGAAVRRRFGQPLAATGGRGETVELNLPAPMQVDHVILMEDISEGERTREFVVEARVEGDWREVFRGQSIGHKRIAGFDPVETASLRWRCLRSLAPPILERFSVHRVR